MRQKDFRVLIETWEASGFEAVLEKGRTKPLVLSCEQWDDDGNVTAKESFVVKAGGLPEVTPASMYREMIGNFIAHKLGVDTPRPILVHLSEEFCSAIRPSLQEYGVKVQPGIGVGCEFISGMSPVIPSAEKTPRELYDALRIFAVDRILQNPERHSQQHNCSGLANGFIAYDFTQSLNFLENRSADYEPWELSKVIFDGPHLFHGSLRGKKSEKYEWTGFIQEVATFDMQELSEMIDRLPAAWIDRPEKVCAHMASMMENAPRLEWQLRESLA